MFYQFYFNFTDFDPKLPFETEKKLFFFFLFLCFNFYSLQISASSISFSIILYIYSILITYLLSSGNFNLKLSKWRISSICYIFYDLIVGFVEFPARSSYFFEKPPTKKEFSYFHLKLQTNTIRASKINSFFVLLGSFYSSSSYIWFI